MNDDVYAGIGDPAFWFHHSQVDHMWTIWQEQDREVRLPQVTKTLTFSNCRWIRDKLIAGREDR